MSEQERTVIGQAVFDDHEMTEEEAEWFRHAMSRPATTQTFKSLPLYEPRPQPTEGENHAH